MTTTATGRPGRYVATLAILAAAAFGAALAALWQTGLPQAGNRLGVGLRALLFVGGFLALQRTGFTYVWRSHRHRVVLDEVAVYVGFLMLPAPLVVALVPAAGLLEQAWTRRPLVKAGFNLSQNLLGATLGWAALASLRVIGTPDIVAALPAAFLYPLTSHFLTAGVFSRLNCGSHWKAFEEGFLEEGLFEGGIGAGAGVAAAVFWTFHPLTLLALAPFVYLANRYGTLSALADREITVRKRLGEVGAEVAGTADLDLAAERLLDTLGELLPTCGRAELSVHTSRGERHFTRDFAAGPPPRALPFKLALPGRNGAVGELRAFPRRGTPALQEVERELLRIVAAQAGAAMEAARALAETEAARARLDAYLRSAGDAVLRVDPSGALHYLNPAAKHLFEDACAGESRHHVNEIFSHPELLTPSERTPALVETTAFNCARTREMIVEVHAARLPDTEPTPGTLLVVRDVTERKRLEAEAAKQREALARQEKLSALGTLVAGVAHEINNPVVYMRGALELATLDLEDAEHAPEATPKLREMLAHAGKSLKKLTEGVDRVDRITHSLKAVARQGNGERRPEDVRAVCEDVAQVVAIGLPRGVRLNLDLQEVPAVHANGSELHQVVLNLVKNAGEALGENGGGTVSVRTRPIQGKVVVEVADDGPGIPEDVQRRLFEPFYTTKATGTGLGLSLCKGIVEAHGGELRVVSAPGKGAVFTVALPAFTGVEVPASPRTNPQARK